VTVVSAELDALRDYEAAGVARCVHWLTSDDAEAARRDIVDLARRLDLSPT
jgi:hypothetical protein